MNDLVSRMMGKSVKEDVPVPCAAVTTQSMRSRLDRMRQRRDPDGIEEVPEDGDDDTVRRVLGESDGDGDDQEQGMDGIFPDDAEDLETMNAGLQTPLRKIKDVVQEPSHPTGEKEKLLTPYSALTAPDVTPLSLEPIDPSKVPGMEPAESFSSADLDSQGIVPMAEPSPAVNAMDVLLGRKRGTPGVASAPERSERVDDPAAVMTEESAHRMVKSMTPGATGEAVLAQGVPMPPPEPSTGGKVMEAYRKFAR